MDRRKRKVNYLFFTRYIYIINNKNNIAPKLRWNRFIERDDLSSLSFYIL